MTNYGAEYILAALPRRQSGRETSVLIALETFTADRDGWRSVSQALLAGRANVDLKTLKRARGELLDKKLIEYRPGQWRGVRSRYRILITPLDKGSPAEPLYGSQRGSTVDPLTRDGKGGQHRAQRGSTKRPKGVNHKPGKHAAPAGQHPDFHQNGQSPALSAEAEALLKLKASARGTSAAAPDGAAADPRAYSAPPCPVCRQPFEQQWLADPELRHAALAGELFHPECAGKEIPI